jgi:hypothetical protein
MPGLIDAHIHTPPKIAIGNQRLFSLLYLRYGVTSVRDTGQSDDSVADLKRNINAGDIAGPRMYRCGPVLDGDPPGWPSAVVLATAQDATETVEQLALDGVDCIKIYNEITPEVYAAVRVAATKHDLPVIGHIPHAVGLQGAQDFESQHLTGVPYVTAARPKIGTDFTSKDIVNVSNEDMDLAVRLSKQNSISYTPTLVNHWQRLIASNPERFPPTTGADYMPAFWDSIWQTVAGHPEGDLSIQTHIEATLQLRDFVRRAHNEGIDILAGTDTIMPWVVPGEALYNELVLLAEIFESTDDALGAATTVSGRHIDKGKIGTIAIGSYADFLLLPADPREDITVLDDWKYIAVNGQLIKRTALDKALNQYRRHFNGGIYSTIMSFAVKDSSDKYSNK